MRPPHATFSRRAFSAIVAAGIALFGAALVVFIRSLGVMSSGVAMSSGPACGCGATNSTTMIGAILAAAVTGALIGATVIRAAVVARAGRSFPRRYRPVPHSSPLAVVASELGILDRVVETDGPRFEVYCAGAFRPRIFVARRVVAALSPAALRAVLEHERHHLRQRDPLRLMIVEALLFTCRLVPGVRPFLHEYRSAVELAADEAVLHRSGADQDLAGALLAFLPLPSVPATITSAVTFFGTTERRVDQLLGIASPRPKARLLGKFLVAVFLVGVSIGVFGSRAVNRASAAETAIGQCHEFHRSCDAPQIPTWERMSTSVRFLSAP